MNRWIRPRSRSFLCKGQLAPVLRRRQRLFASIAVQYKGRDARSFPTRLLLQTACFVGQVSDVSNCKVKVWPSNEIIGPCYQWRRDAQLSITDLDYFDR